jgi:hypothetical protein
MSNTPQGGAIEGKKADDTLMVDQGGRFEKHNYYDFISIVSYREST